jgi:hypothetical protein
MPTWAVVVMVLLCIHTQQRVCAFRLISSTPSTLLPSRSARTRYCGNYNVASPAGVGHRYSAVSRLLHNALNNNVNTDNDDDPNDVRDEPQTSSTQDEENTIAHLYENVHFESLQPDDPLWLHVGSIHAHKRDDPTLRAYARHFNWMRSLDHSERVRWREWATEQLRRRFFNKSPQEHQELMMFDYCVDDFMLQKMLKALANKNKQGASASPQQRASPVKAIASEEASKLDYTFTDFPDNIDALGPSTQLRSNPHPSSNINSAPIHTQSPTQSQSQSQSPSVWTAVADQLLQQDVLDIRSVMLAFYKAMSDRNIQDTKVFWLPSDDAELTLPGFDREVQLLYSCD